MTEIPDLKKIILQYLGFCKKKSQSQLNELVLVEVKSQPDEFMSKSFCVEHLDRESFILSCLPSQSLLLPSKDPENFSFKAIFDSIKQKFQTTGLIRIDGNRNEAEIHISIITQFWLDCFVTFQVFLNMLLAPIRDKEWIQYEDFLKSIDAVHQKNVCRAFFSTKQDKKFSATVRVQKLLCTNYLVYFCIVEYEVKKIDLKGLIKVLELAHKMPKSREKELKILAEGFIHKANQLRKYQKTTISLKEFYSLLISSLAL